jgi:hypothetical protein
MTLNNSIPSFSLKKTLDSAVITTTAEDLPYNTTFDSNEILEECLLATMAAGIPQGCIRITPAQENMELHSCEKQYVFEFINPIN